MQLKKLTSKGMAHLEQDLLKWKKEGKVNPSLDIKDYESQEIADHDIELDKNMYFEKKMAVGKYFLHIFPEAFYPSPEIWNWLSLVYFRQLLTEKKTVGELKRLFVPKNYSFYPYRHLLKSPYDICKFYKNFYKDKEGSQWTQEIDFLLSDKVNMNSELFRRIAENQDIVKNPKFIKIARMLFYDETSQTVKRGITDKVNRLIMIWKQYERSFDMYNMPEANIKNLLSHYEEFSY